MQKKQIFVTLQAVGGPGLAFIAFTEAILKFPGENVWSVFFFLILAFLGLSTVICSISSTAVSVRDLGFRPSKPVMAAIFSAGLLFYTAKIS